MSHNSLRGTIPSHRRATRRPSQSQPSSSSHTLRRGVLEKPVKVIKRCNSEPSLLNLDVTVDGVDDHDGLIVHRRSYSPAKIEGYDKDGKVVVNVTVEGSPGPDKNGKVVVNVTVEGSPGPVRTMLKLGSSVQETMDIIKKQYNSEGRSPQLDQHSLSTFQLHQSYFSLHCLDKSDMIWDIGSRSFYMRKCNNDNSSFTGSGIISTKGNDSPPQNPIIVFPNFISSSFKKIMKMSSKISKILGCIDR